MPRSFRLVNHTLAGSYPSDVSQMSRVRLNLQDLELAGNGKPALEAKNIGFVGRGLSEAAQAEAAPAPLHPIENRWPNSRRALHD